MLYQEEMDVPSRLEPADDGCAARATAAAGPRPPRARTPRAAVHGDHLYAGLRSDEDRQQAVAALVGSALASGEWVLHLTHGDSPDTVLASLDDAGVDVGRAVQGGALMVAPLGAELAGFPGEAARMGASLQTKIDRALRDGHRGARLIVDMSWAVDQPALEAPLMGFESLLESISETRPATVVCQYDARSLPGSRLGSLALCHSHLLVPPMEPLLCGEDLASCRLDDAEHWELVFSELVGFLRTQCLSTRLVDRYQRQLDLWRWWRELLVQYSHADRVPEPAR